MVVDVTTEAVIDRPREVVASYAADPVNLIQVGIVILAGLTWANSLLSSAIVYTLLGCSIGAAAGHTVLTAFAGFCYHWNIRTPHWLGYIVQPRCGFDAWREDRLEDMLAFRNVNGAQADARPALHFLPTCIGCSERWACLEAREQRGDEGLGSD